MKKLARTRLFSLKRLRICACDQWSD